MEYFDAISNALDERSSEELTKPFERWDWDSRNLRHGVYLSEDGQYVFRNNAYEKKKDLIIAMMKCGIEDYDFIENLPEIKQFIIKSGKGWLGNGDIAHGNLISFGYVIENGINKFIQANGGTLIDRDSKKNRKGERQLDTYFKFNDLNHYYEIKLNLELDTEKKVATVAKIQHVIEKIINVDKYGILWPIKLNCMIDYNGIPVIGTNEFLAIFNKDPISKQTFLQMGKVFGDKIVEKQKHGEQSYRIKADAQKLLLK